MSVELTRDDVVLIAQAVEEFRDEYVGPHINTNREFAERLRMVLREFGGDRFILDGERS